MSKIGLCLSGGGARGPYQVGAVKALEEMGIMDKITCYAGTSIGSVNSCLVSSGGSAYALEAWNSVNSEIVVQTEHFISLLIKERSNIVEKGCFQIDAFQKALMKVLQPEKIRGKHVYATISDGGAVSTGFFGLMRANYEHFIKLDSKVAYVPLDNETDEEIRKTVMASCSIPFVFPPVRIDGHNYYDGGLYDNIPLTPLVANGCDKAIVVNLNRFDYLERDKYPELKIIEIKHSRLLGSVLKFDSERCRQLYELGYEETKKTIDPLILSDFLEE